MAVTTTAGAMPARVDLDVYRGDSWSQQFRFLSDDVPTDLTDVVIESQARGSDGTSADLVVTVIGDPTDGTITLEKPTSGLKPDLYSYDIEVTDAGAVTTWVRGRLRVTRDVTNEQP